MFGKLFSICPDPKGFLRLVIQVKTPYSTTWKRFNIWKLKRLERIVGGPLTEGDSVKFEEDTTAQYPTLTAMDFVLLDNCELCHGYYELGDAQRAVRECGECKNRVSRERVDEELKLVHTKEKKYTFSSGITLTFTDTDETTTFSTCIFERSPIYNGVKGLKEEEMYRVQGWITSKADKGLDGIKCLIELEDTPK